MKLQIFKFKLSMLVINKNLLNSYVNLSIDISLALIVDKKSAKAVFSVLMIKNSCMILRRQNK